MKDWLTEQYQQIRRNGFVIFLAGSVFGTGLETLINYLFQEQGLSGLVTFGLTLVGLVILFQLLRWLADFLKVPRRAIVGSVPVARRGMIFVYSRPETLTRAIEHHHDDLSYIWLVVTPEAKENLDLSQFRREGLQIFTQDVTGSWSPDAAAGAVVRALAHAKELKLSESDLICDITGGTKAMTVGAIRTCLMDDLDMQMVPAEYDTELKRPVPLTPIQVEI